MGMILGCHDDDDNYDNDHSMFMSWDREDAARRAFIMDQSMVVHRDWDDLSDEEKAQWYNS